MPVFRTKKEAFQWLESGQKTIDVRKGNPFKGENAVYISGKKVLRLRIAKTEQGSLTEILREDNFQRIIPSALTLEDAAAYLLRLHPGFNGSYTAYHVVPLKSALEPC
jgi:ASC-1-like (ASCH) protein